MIKTIGNWYYVYVLFEHKSDVEARINLDLLRYRVRIGEQWLNDGNMGLLPVIIPVVFYHGAARWGATAVCGNGGGSAGVATIRAGLRVSSPGLSLINWVSSCL